MSRSESRQYGLKIDAYPALRIVMFFVFGIVMASILPLRVDLILLVLALCVILYWLGEFVAKRRPSPTLSMYLIIVYHIIVVIAGLYRAQSLRVDEDSLSNPTSAQRNLDAFERQPIDIRATIVQVRQRQTGATVWLKADSIFAEGIPVMLSPIQLLMRWPDGYTVPETGDRIRASARLRTLSKPGNPFEFDYGAYLRGQGILYQGWVDTVFTRDPPKSRFGWLYWRRIADQTLRIAFSAEQIPIAKALLLGQKGDVETDERQAFARSGLSHLMAVSGLHVGFLIAPFWMLIPLIWSTRVGRHCGFAIIAITLFLYCGITGFPASVVRASVMATLAAYAKVYRHPRDPLNLMGLAALIILVIDPSSLYDLGFQLSFSAVTILLVVMPSIQRRLPERLNRKPWSILSGLILVSVIVQIGLYPILVSGFGEFTVAGPIANLLGIPLTQVMILWSLFGLPIGSILPEWAPIIMWPADRAAWSLRVTAEIVSSWTWAWWYVAKPSAMIYPVWVAFACWIASWSKPALRWKCLAAVLFMLSLWMGESIYTKHNRPLAEVLFFDVGQGDAALIRTAEGSAWLIDTGIYSPGFESGSRTIMPVLRRLGVDHLNGVILSHPHADHIGGILAIINSMPVDTIYEADFPTSSAVVAGYKAAARKNDVPIAPLRHGRILRMGNQVRGYVLGPIDPEFHTDPNTASVIVRVDAGNVRFLFTGDADQEAESIVIDRYGPLLQSTVLKAGHHGSKTSSGLPFMAAVNPKHVVISLAWINRYKHPHADAVERLRSTGAELHFTSLKGAVWMATDGETVWEKAY